MKLTDRISIMAKLGSYMAENSPEWEAAKDKAASENAWFIPAFIELSVENIHRHFLQPDLLQIWAEENKIPDIQPSPQKIGLLMAGNIPLVGFHDFLCIFMSGHMQKIKMSSRDSVLLQHLIH